MGSLLPLSSSRVGLKLERKARFLDLNIENTAAASVEEMIAPNNKPSIKEKSVICQAKVPIHKAVISTPKVERDIPCHKTG